MSKILTFGGYALTVGNNAVAASAVNPYVPTLYKITYISTAGYFRTEPTPKSAYGGEQVTGGTINGNTLTVTGPCTARAVFSANAFTASGGFEKGSDVTVTSNRSTTDANVPAKYATTSYHTSNVPTAWYNTSNRWKVTSEVSGYQITLKPYMRFTMAGNSYTNSPTYAAVTAVSLIGSTQTQSQNFSKNWTNKESSTVTSNYSKNFTNTSTGVNYGLSAKLRASGYYHSSITQYSVTTKYIASQTTGTWVATGYVP